MGKTTKKALIYDPYLDTLGGGERYCLTVAECLLKEGWEVHFWWRGQNILEKARKRFGLKLKGLELKNIDLKSLFQRLKLTRGYDLVFWLSDGSIPLLLSNNNIVHFQVPFKNTSTNKVLNKVKFKLIDHIVCNSKFTKKYIDQEYDTSSKVLYPPIAVEEFKAAKKKKIILGVGRFEQSMQAKRQDILIEAFKKLVKKGHKDWQLVLIGGSLGDPGKNKFLSSLKKQAEGFSVKFLVNSSFPDLKKYYSQSSFFWHAAGFGVNEQKEPWRTEHFGIAPVEAMAAGCVPLVMDKGGLKEIVRREMGERWNTAEELVEKTIGLIEDKERYKKYQVKAKLRSEDFSIAKFSQEMKGLLKK